MQKTVLLGLCLIILAACKTTNIAVYRGKDLSKYMQTPHFRAFAVAKGRSGGYVSYRAVGRPSVEIAMEDAIKGCKRYFALYLTIHPDCRVIFIGDTDIENMPQAEVDAVILAYKQEQETINSNLAELSDKIVCDTALQKNRLRWEANADSSAYVQQAVKRSLTPQHCAALMGRPTASLTNTAANKNSKSSPVAVNWAGYDKPMAGTVNYLQQGKLGVVSVSLPDGLGTCNGRYEFENNRSNFAIWFVTCPSNLAAYGTLNGFGKDKGAVGEGVDLQGKKVTFSIGKKLSE